MRLALSVVTALAVKAGAFSFTYDRHQFYVDDSPLQIFGGEIQPQRIPREFWADRLDKAKAMGLNTIFSYVFWNAVEPQPGEWDFEGQNDLGAWFQAVQDAGLYAVLRPGPYVCGEWEWGGLPGWLNNIPNTEVRKNNANFLEASGRYIARLGEELRDYQSSHGGPLLMVQVENEYGHYGSDMVYKQAIVDQITAAFDLIPYTNDAGTQKALAGGSIPGILALTDGEDPKKAFAARDEFVTDESMLGPLLDGEFYIWWFTAWGPNSKYNNYENDSQRREKFLNDTQWVLDGGNSFNLFMGHGATNWGFTNGALDFGNGLQAFTTSYDYGAPIDESGRPTGLYYDLRAMIKAHAPETGIPEVLETPPLQAIHPFELTPSRALFDDLDLAKNSTTTSPATLESFENYTGFVLYETTINETVSGLLEPGDKPRDRVIVYINGTRHGVIDPIHKEVNKVEVNVASGDHLQLLVENLGRVDFSGAMADQVKGIVGEVNIGSTVIHDWTQYSLPLASIPDAVGTSTMDVVSDDGTPAWYRGTFTNDKSGAAADTWLALSGIKGVAWINGFNLGRYWMVGPQQSLYVPGSRLRRGENELIVLDLEPTTAPFVAEGLSDRLWFNNDDPDCGTCVYADPSGAP